MVGRLRVCTSATMSLRSLSADGGAVMNSLSAVGQLTSRSLLAFTKGRDTTTSGRAGNTGCGIFGRVIEARNTVCPIGVGVLWVCGNEAGALDGGVFLLMGLW